MKRQIAHSMSFDFKLLYSLNTQMFDTFKLQIPVLLKWLTLVNSSSMSELTLGGNSWNTALHKYRYKYRDKYSFKYRPIQLQIQRQTQMQVQIQYVTMTWGGWDNGKTWNRSKFDAKPADSCRIKQGCLNFRLKTWIRSVIIHTLSRANFVPLSQVVLVSCLLLALVSIGTWTIYRRALFLWRRDCFADFSLIYL